MLNNGGIGSSGKRSLVVGFMNGRLPKTYVKKDYEQLQWAITQAGNESRRSERKVGALESANKVAVEHQMDSMHRRVWLKEWERLTTFRTRFQRDLDEVLQLISLMPRGDDNSLIELVEQQEALDEGVIQFQGSTLAPIQEFCEDIDFWIKNRKRDLHLGQDPSLIGETIESIKSQQYELLAVMDDEQAQFERALRIRNLQAELDDDDYSGDVLADVDDMDYISTARTDASPPFPNRLPIPEDIANEEEVDPEMKQTLLAEFVNLDDSFFEQLCLLHENIRRLRFQVRQVEEKMTARDQQQSLLQVVVDEHSGLRVGGDAVEVDPWKLLVFEGVYRRAPQDMPKSWYLLYLHFLQLLYPRQKKWQLSQGASLVHQYMALKKRSKIVRDDWRRCHTELAQRIRTLMARLAEEERSAHRRSVDLAEQRRFCLMLTEQVNNWRRLKLEEAKLMHELDMAKMTEEAEKLAVVAEREKENDRLKRDKIAKFKEAKAQRRDEQKRKAEERLAQVKQQLAEQAELDWQRINFRKELLEDKRVVADLKKQQAEEEEQRKEERLESLRKTVRVEAQSNLARTMGDTETWRNHDERYLRMIRAEQHADGEEWIESKPLFNMGGFSSKQILSDKRVILEQRLRETGLIASEYGRQIMARIKPPTVARRDQLGTLGVGDLLPPPAVQAPRPDNPYFYTPNR